VRYAPINPDGTIGTWSSTESFSTGRTSPDLVAYNGYMYLTGGYNGSHFNNAQYAKIDPPGSTSNYIVTSNFSTARYDHATVVHNSYIYVLGGSPDGTNSSFSIQY